MSDLTDQIEDLIDRTVIVPVEGVLGMDLAQLLRERAETRVQVLASELVSEDKRLAAEAALTVSELLPEPIPSEFWPTPLGRAVLATYESPQTVGATDAARILGVTRGRVYQLRDAGQLKAAPDGAFLLSSVLDRLARD